jgi:hypothetical protein
MDMETYSGDNFSPGLLPGEHSDGMEDEDDYEAGVNFQKYAYSRCQLQNFTMSHHACHVLLPGEHSDGMEDEDYYEAGVVFNMDAYSTCEVHNLKFPPCHGMLAVLLPGEWSDGMEAKDDYEGGANLGFFRVQRGSAWHGCRVHQGLAGHGGWR